MIESPCTKVCTLDPTGHICLGCRRTLDEIAAWGEMTDLERARILAELPQRRLPDAANKDPLSGG